MCVLDGYWKNGSAVKRLTLMAGPRTGDGCRSRLAGRSFQVKRLVDFCEGDEAEILQYLFLRSSAITPELGNPVLYQPGFYGLVA